MFVCCVGFQCYCQWCKCGVDYLVGVLRNLWYAYYCEMLVMLNKSGENLLHGFFNIPF